MTRVPDEDAGMPPSLDAYMFLCSACNGTEWMTPSDLGALDWEDIDL